MPKNIEDIIPPRKTIRNIPIPAARKRKASKPESIKEFERGAEEVPIHVEKASPRDEARERYREMMSARPRKIFGKKTWTTLVAAGLIVAFMLMTIFAGGTLAYTPKSVKLNFDKEGYTAQKTGSSGLLFSVVKLSGEKGKDVEASGEQDVSRKASGTIIVYNSGAAAQALVENTRFETPEGKIYRIANAINVPAKRGETPGSVEAVVYADQPGDAYNIGLSDFTLPGLKGTPKFTQVYARSKSAMSGGFVGKEKSVTPETLRQAKSALEIELKDALIKEAQAQVPEDFVLFPTLSSVTYEDLPQTDRNASTATVNMRGNLYSVMFKRSDLARYLATRKTVVASSETVDIENLEDLAFNFTGTPPADLLTSSTINFDVTGSANVVWLTDETALKSDLLGKDKKDVAGILNNYPSVASATTIVRPFWKSSFPDDITRITLKRQPIQ